MAIHVAVEHRTTYRFDRPVPLFPHLVRLRPAPHCRTPVLAYSLQVTPDEHFINWQQDPFGNHVARLVFPQPSDELTLTVDLVADMTVINPFDFFVDEEARAFPFRYPDRLGPGLAPYLASEAPGPLVRDWIADLPHHRPGTMLTIDVLVELNRLLHRDVAYTVRMEPGVQTPDETLAKALGSCRDTAWLLVTILRELGLAARFVSGYLVQLRSDQPPLDGPAGPDADFTDLHAWAEVYVPGAGWIGLDPTSGLLAGEGHLPLACTPEPSLAAPVEGAIAPAEVVFEHANLVRRIREDPRVTLPYDDEQWARIDTLGRAIDDRLAAGDVRLTQGGEPTFVSADDLESPQWTVAADGPDKRARAVELTRRLARRFAPGALLHRGQGKWYPGEPLPRWQHGVFWRADGVALWRDEALLADWSAPGSAGAGDAERLARAIAADLGVPEGYLLPAYEDRLHQVCQEARLPVGEPVTTDLDPTDGALRDTETRAAAVRALDTITGDPAAWVLPLHRTPDRRWATTGWRFRRGRLVLVPGDSPAGLRLPLDSVAWSPPPQAPDRSPFDPRTPLPTGAPSPGPAVVVPVGEAPTTALCVEVRDGHPHVFLPPLTYLEDVVELLAVVERAAADCALAVVVEGYPPPHDPRVRHLAVAPDPGVIEINLHPASSWDELVDITTGLYEEARACRLVAETFMLDGTHAGTGGGNHMTLGGPSAPDSPMLRRPDLLRSLITFWQHHPSLSYLFSGRFIGPTSQSPRVDEGRNENLYELEIAFAEMERLGAAGPGRPGEDDTPGVPPWLVDRLLRNLLVDVTGNTHRAEFCIDKLFNPEGERGRLGLVELRAFEMPPHPRMALVQALLVRSIVARCWEDPYTGELIRWGTDLHDRFMLPWFVAHDIAEVVADLRRHGIAFEEGWLAPFLEFRFPRLGSVEVFGITVELRRAIEPWHVLGEEATSTGTARYVDSSVERLQVLVEGMTDTRHALTCNGVAVPLSPTGTPGTFVAGVRYRAWQPPSALHPTIGVHTPLVFDLVDRWNRRSLGGCTYHVSHPGGRAYDRFPVNANEAEARRTGRFVPHGHTPGPLDPGHPGLVGRAGGREYPRTLDLRRARTT